mmetsp:Transcript_29736/g.63137  ORF Transcript_29736/g.63137 Transcript_29736/m.63137 type:complete len:213 (+) Transcript_29736:297-935(+)
MILIKMRRDFVPTTDPNIIPKTLCKVKEVFECFGPAGTSNQTAMQTYAHHLRCSSLSLFDEIAQTILQVGEKLSAVGESIRNCEPHIIFAQCVRNDEVWFSVLGGPVRKVVSVGIGIVEKASLLDDEFTRVDVRLPLIHSHGPSQPHFLVNLHRPLNVFPFHRFVDILIIPPAISVTGDLPTRTCHGFAGRRIPFQGHAHSKYGARNLFTNQ